MINFISYSAVLKYIPNYSNLSIGVKQCIFLYFCLVQHCKHAGVALAQKKARENVLYILKGVAHDTGLPQQYISPESVCQFCNTTVCIGQKSESTVILVLRSSL